MIEACTTAAKTKRHYTTDFAPDRHAPRTPGRTGKTLCGNYGIDELRANWERDRLLRRPKPLVVADLPECKLCARAKTARANAASDRIPV